MDKNLFTTLEEIQEEQKALPLGIMRHILTQNKNLRPAKDLVIAIQGVRRCGKSTLLRQIAHNQNITEHSIFINFEDPRLGDKACALQSQLRLAWILEKN